MDVYCSNCGEPWDQDEFHDVAEEFESTYTVIARTFRQYGCAVFTHGQDTKAATCTRIDSDVTAAAFAAYEVCGDDIDGAAALLEDFIGGY